VTCFFALDFRIGWREGVLAKPLLKRQGRHPRRINKTQFQQSSRFSRRIVKVPIVTEIDFRLVGQMQRT
jgi:hypothetical protein